MSDKDILREIEDVGWFEALKVFLTSKGSPRSWKMAELVTKSGESRWGIIADEKPFIITGSEEAMQALVACILIAEAAVGPMIEEEEELKTWN